MKAYLNALAALAVPALALAFAPTAPAQSTQGYQNQGYPYQTPGTQGWQQPGSYWQQYYGVQQTYPGQGYGQQQQYQPQQSQRPGQSWLQGQPQYTSQGIQGQQHGGMAQGQEQQIRGRIVRTRQIDLPGGDGEIIAALVDTTQGRVVVDLGPREELRENNVTIQRGEQISAWGHFARVGSSRVFVAESVRADGRTVDIDRSWTMTVQQLRNEANAFSGYTGSSQAQQQSQTGSRQWADQRQMGYARDDDFGYSQRGSQTGYQRDDQQQRYSQQGSQSSQSQQRFSGRVTRTQRIELPGMHSELCCCLMQTDDGRQVTCILGPEDELQNLRLQRGEELTVRGTPTFVGGRQVVLARQISANGQTVQLPVQRSQSQRISGEITRTRRIQLPGLQQDIQVACVRTDQGQQVICILGPEETMGRHDLSRGEEVSLRGDLLDVNGQQILLTQQIRSHGEQTNLNHQPY